jgi:hypothetical protein
VALMAMREQPDGFPRYRDKADSLSALVNQALDARKLRPEPGQTLYSLRHTFEDRLTVVEAPEKVVAALMGHKWHRPRYGLGPSLEQTRDWLNRHLATRNRRAICKGKVVASHTLRLVRDHRDGSSTRGSTILARKPPRGRLSSVTVPPWACTTPCAMARPRPTPPVSRLRD